MTEASQSITTPWHEWLSDADSMLSPKYAQYLLWNEDLHLGQSIVSGYLRFCEEKGLELLQEARCNELFQLACILGSEKVQNIFSSPRISWRFLQQGFSAETDSLEIAEALIAEAILQGLNFPTEKTLYSALCDQVIDPGKTPRQIAAFIDELPFPIEVLQTRNIFANKGNAVHSAEHSEAECRKGIEMIRKGALTLKSAAPAAYSFVCRMIAVLAIRANKATPVFETGTFSGYTGLVLFTNTHVAKVDEVMEGLVHEAVHCMLYMHEGVSQGFLTNPEKEDHILVSPWTGAHIRTQSFIHACFVWYAVHHLWRTCAEAGWNTADSKKRADFARQGFMFAPVTRILLKSGVKLKTGLLSSLKEIERLMMEEF